MGSSFLFRIIAPFLSGGSDDSSFGSRIKEFVEKYLVVNVWTLLIHIVCACLLIACISLWVWKPTNEFLAKYKRGLDQEKQDLIVNNRESRYYLNILKKERTSMFNLRRDTEKRLRVEAAAIIENAEREAERRADRIKRDAEERIRMVEDKVKEELKKSVVNLSVELTEKLIGANITPENSEKVIDSYLKDLEGRQITPRI